MSFERLSDKAKKTVFLVTEFERAYRGATSTDVCYVSPEAFSDWVENVPNLITGRGGELRFMNIPIRVVENLYESYKGLPAKNKIPKLQRMVFRPDV